MVTRTRLPTALAAGAWLKNAACRLDAAGAQWSAVHGDLGDPEACRALEASMRALAAQAPRGAPVAALAHDLHPDFFSTRIARTLADEWGVPAIAVQHHHAHIGVVMADHGLDEPVVGLALDGVGLGTDGTAWGGELLWVSPTGWQRLGGFVPLALPGGDVAAREPWRMAASALHALGRGDEIEPRFAGAVGATAARAVQRLLATGLHCPATSSAGRCFDAAAAALGLCLRQAHEAQAAMSLEQQAAQWLADRSLAPLVGLVNRADLTRLDLRPLLQGLLDWPGREAHTSEAHTSEAHTSEADVGEAAAWFHVSLAHALVEWATAAARHTGTRTVCLGGGCFFNAVLRERVLQGLHARGLRALLPRSTHCGDAGLALGQAWVAAQQLAHATATSPSPSAPLTESLTCA